jgi:prolyl 4-hydroxylase
MSHLVRVVPQLLSKDECSTLVKRLKESPLLQAERNGANYVRSVFFDKDLARVISQRMLHLVPKKIGFSGDIPRVEISDRFRFSKYDQKGKFALHQDGIYQDPRTGWRSAYTVSIFLNDSFSGGETVFFDGSSLGEASQSQSLPVQPETGKAVLFPREVYHCGNEVLDGYKYLLRTDVMVAL